MGDKQVLKYKDVVLRSSDLDTLRDSCFLNDQIITFYLTYLFSSSKTDDIVFVRPSISVCLANCEDDKFVEEFAQSCKLLSKRLVLFVVNDNDAYGGSHWSILVYDRRSNSFQHYDSMEGVDSFHAMKLYDAVKEYMGPGGEVSRPQTSSSSLKKQRNKKKHVQSASKPLASTKSESVAVTGTTTPAALPKFVESKTPQQSNGYDCGLYVLAIARAICQWSSCKHNNSDVLSAIQKNVDDSVEVKMRGELLEIIQELLED